jgi:hypothetical protein
MTGILSPIIMNSPALGFRSSKFKYIVPGVFASALLIANHAPAAPASENGEAQQLVQVHRACESAMGLSSATNEYAECVDSLRQSLAGANEVASLEKDRAACAQEGLKPETADFGLCVIDRDNAVTNSH